MFLCIYLLLGLVTTLAGDAVVFGGSNDGVGTNAKFYSPAGIAVNPAGDMVFVVDNANNNVRTISLPSGSICIFYFIFLKLYIWLVVLLFLL